MSFFGWGTKLPNLKCATFKNIAFWPKLPNFMPAKFSRYTVAHQRNFIQQMHHFALMHSWSWKIQINYSYKQQIVLTLTCDVGEAPRPWLALLTRSTLWMHGLLHVALPHAIYLTVSSPTAVSGWWTSTETALPLTLVITTSWSSLPSLRMRAKREWSLTSFRYMQG